MPLGWQTLSVHNIIGILAHLLHFLSMISGGYQNPSF
jgi:hypothetical protein